MNGECVCVCETPNISRCQRMNIVNKIYSIFLSHHFETGCCGGEQAERMKQQQQKMR